MSSTLLRDQVWMLRSPCGCLWGASMVAYTEPKAWAALYGGDATKPRPAGWTLTLEPSDVAVPEARQTLGKCTHLERKARQ
ncbi:hypothetical protein ACIODS_12350 [Micromonospora chalcea]|uniref:hypothetical protein n=1 Tax=Micromonospora chalcea TaxID=1874 RepID=UPI00382B3389